MRYVAWLSTNGEYRRELETSSPIVEGQTIDVDGETWIVTSVQPGDGTTAGIVHARRADPITGDNG